MDATDEVDASDPIRVVATATVGDRGFVAWLNRCIHLCCVPSGFKQSARADGAENAVYCQCHRSI